MERLGLGDVLNLYVGVTLDRDISRKERRQRLNALTVALNKNFSVQIEGLLWLKEYKNESK